MPVSLIQQADKCDTLYTSARKHARSY